MKLHYPISTELFTFVHLLNRSVEVSLRRECGLSVIQYRVLSCLKQAGETQERALLRILEISPSRLSQALGKLSREEYIHLGTMGGPAKTIRLASAGRQALRRADEVLVDVCNQVFDPLGPELGAAIRSGSMLTNQRHGVVRIENGDFFEEHACFEAFLHSEEITKESTRSYGFTETEFRIAFALLIGGPTSKSKLAHLLRCAASVITDACKKLEDRQVITVFTTPNDKRLHVAALTETGRALTEEAAEYVDQRALDEIRPSSDDERTLYQHMADIIVQQPFA